MTTFGKSGKEKARQQYLEEIVHGMSKMMLEDEVERMELHSMIRSLEVDLSEEDE